MADPQKLHVEMMRSQLGRVRGLGSAKHGVGHWWAQRLTAVALVPLTLWFIFSVYALIGLPQAEMAHWVAHPVNTVLLLALVIATFHHSQLGLQVVIEDYVHSEFTRFASLLAVKGIHALLVLAAVVAVLKLSFIG